MTPECHQYSRSKEAPHEDEKRKDDVYHKSESSTSDTGSSDENISDPFSMLELGDNFGITKSKVDKVTQ